MKAFGKKIYPKDIIINLFELSDEAIVQKAIKKSQEESLTHKDKRELFIKESAAKFGGSPEQVEAKMMELMNGIVKSLLPTLITMGTFHQK